MNLKNIILIALCIAGTVIGAGFASGKEIMLFFPQKGLSGIFSLFVSVFVMACVSLLYCYKKKVASDRFFEALFTLFLAASFSVMLSCGGETIKESVGISFYVGVVITYIISLFIIHFDVSGICIFNLIATPVMILSTVIISLNALSVTVWDNLSPAFLSASYSGYNLLSLTPFLHSLKKETDKKTLLCATVAGFVFVLLCGIFIKITLDTYSDFILNSEIPMLEIAFSNNKVLGILHSINIYSAIITTAISSLLPLKEKGNIYLLTAPLLAISFFGFGNLIKNIYGFFGNIGTVFIIYIIISAIFFEKGVTKNGKRTKFHSEYHIGKP